MNNTRYRESAREWVANDEVGHDLKNSGVAEKKVDNAFRFEGLRQNRFREKTLEKVRKNVFKQTITSPTDSSRRCIKCKHFNFTLVDLRLKDEGLCTKFPPYVIQMGNRHNMSYGSEYASTHKNRSCGMFDKK